MELEQLQQLPAIKALGSLFKFTQSRLWDDSPTSSWSRGESQYRKDDLDVDAGLSTTTMSSDDLELAAQMDALGLPLSFATNKRNNMVRGKRKDPNKNHLHTDAEIKDAVPNFITVSEHEIISPNIIHDNLSGSLCCMSMPSQNESSNCDVAVDVKFVSSETEDPATVTKSVVCAAVTENSGSDNTSEKLSYCQSCGSVNNQNLSKDNTVMESSAISFDNGFSARSFLIKNEGSGHSQKNEKAGLTEPTYLEVPSVGNCTDLEKLISNIWTKLSEDSKSHDAVHPQFSQAPDNDTIDSDCLSEDNQSKECEKLLDEICDRISQGPDSACSLFTEVLNCDSIDAVNPSVQNQCADYGRS